MIEFLKFSTEEEFRQKRNTLDDLWVAYVSETKKAYYSYDYQPFCLTALNDNVTIIIRRGTFVAASQVFKQLYYRINDGSIKRFDVQITLQKDDKCYIFGDNDGFTGIVNDEGELQTYLTFSITGEVKASGNIFSVNDYDRNITPYAFYKLFNNCTSLVDAEELDINVTEAKPHCFSNMFYGCNSLKTCPQLPATKLGEHCYESMFSNCEKLIYPPKILPAKIIPESAYSHMFNYCSKLLETPKINAYNVYTEGCTFMFYACFSLIKVSDLNLNNLYDKACYYMFSNCQSMPNGPKLGNFKLLGTACMQNMFHGCYALTDYKPFLPPTYVPTDSYRYMFASCTHLNETTELGHIKKLETTSLTGMYQYSGITKVNSLPKDVNLSQPMTAFLRSLSGKLEELYVPFEGNVGSYALANFVLYAKNLKYIHTVFTTITGGALNNWVDGVAQEGIFVMNIEATWWANGAIGIPDNWKIIYIDTNENKYYTTVDKRQECDSHGNLI